MAILRKKTKPVLERSARFSCRLDALADAMAAADAAAGAPDLSPRWVQVATAGDYRGYAGGAFVFDDKIFAQIIANFRTHPSYVATNGIGSADVIPWDFNHASASFAADGSIPITGTPAQGWIQELKTIPDAAGTQLWALTNWLEPARSYILQNKYKWASVVVGFDCRDQKTNTNIGAVLESVALTNNPFIEGMQKLVADNRQGKKMPGQRAQLEWYGRTASDPEDAFCCLRDMFGLPQTADIGSVLAELMKLQTWATSGGAPIGVDLDTLVSNVRTIFNMPALSSTEEVFAESAKLLGALLQQQALEQTETEIPSAPAAAQDPAAMAAAAQAENRHMSILKIIATRLGVQETEAAATQALEGLFALRTTLAKLLGQAEHATDKVLLDAAAGAGDARTKLGALLAALGIEDSGAAVEKIAGLMKQASELEAAMPELKSLREAAAATEEKAAEADVSKVANSLSITNPGLKLALSIMRKANKKEFQTQYADVLAKEPEAAPAAGAAGHAYLTTNISGAAGGAERTVTTNQDGSVALSAPNAGAKGGAPTGGKVQIKLTGLPGRNKTERLHSHIRATVAGADKFTFDQLMTAGIELARTAELVD